MNLTPELEIIPISALNQYSYCPRRCYLIHSEGLFSDNVHTLRGTHEHERVDQVLHEIKQGIRIEFALPVWSDKLGLSGRCDVVEFHPDGAIFPVEYKHGKKKKWANDDLQLAAQAVCLQEMKGGEVSSGAIYHIQSKRRRNVAITPELIADVAYHTGIVRELFQQQKLPPPTEQTQRCKGCSMVEACSPDVAKAAQQIALLSKNLYLVEDDFSEPVSISNSTI
ncbi:MAG: CRISPR-associated protein Cas4 [Gammaproteobacteria bacterium]|nr:MAG: CRISPR-associated protein Cas4 [Gammaproteobacteria bacterium]